MYMYTQELFCTSLLHIYTRTVLRHFFLTNVHIYVHTHTHTYILQEVFCTTHAINEPNSIASFLGISGFHSCYHLLFIKRLFCMQSNLFYYIVFTNKIDWESYELRNILEICLKIDIEGRTITLWVLNGWVVFHIIVRGSMKSKSCLEYLPYGLGSIVHALFFLILLIHVVFFFQSITQQKKIKHRRKIWELFLFNVGHSRVSLILQLSHF